MTRRRLIVLLLLPLTLVTLDRFCPTAAIAKDGDSGGGGGHGGDGGGRGGGDNSGRGSDNSGWGGGDDNGRGGDGGRGRGRGGDDDGGQGRGRGRGGDDAPAGAYGGGWGSTSSDHARQAVSEGWALALSTILPTVTKAVPGQVLEVDLRQSWSGEWRYEFLVLSRDRRYQEVVVDARRNRILQIRSR